MNRNIIVALMSCCVLVSCGVKCSAAADNATGKEKTNRPNIVLVMTDDQGWGQTGYYNHPVLKTPNLDAMAIAGLRLDRFYAGAPNCSPTRSTVMTGRSNDRTGVFNHGYPMRLQEKALPQAMREAGYATGHFGKWHLNGFRGPGVPVLGDDPRSPGAFGFDQWLSVTNFFDRDPLMSRQGKIEEFGGDSSEIIVDESLKFIARQAKESKPFFVVIWYGSPHNPFRAADVDMQQFADLDPQSQQHYGELVAMDRSIGTLRAGLRQLGVADNTLLWYNSDNGGLPGIKPETVGGLRGFKGSVYEGGLRVPCIIEWPEVITEPRISEFPTGTVDIFPTIADIVGLPESSRLAPCDGISIRSLFEQELDRREKPLAFRHTGRTAMIDHDWKLAKLKIDQENYELYNLADDPQEQNNLFDQQPEIAKRMVRQMADWNHSVDASVAGKDYPEGQVDPNHPEPIYWNKSEKYRPYFDLFRDRPEYQRYLK